MVRWQKKAVAAGAALVLVAALGACSSSGGKQEEQKASGSVRQRGEHAADEGCPDHPLRSRVTPSGTSSGAGAEAAAKKDNIELQYSGDPDGADQANLVQTRDRLARSTASRSR